MPRGSRLPQQTEQAAERVAKQAAEQAELLHLRFPARTVIGLVFLLGCLPHERAKLPAGDYPLALITATDSVSDRQVATIGPFRMKDGQIDQEGEDALRLHVEGGWVIDLLALSEEDLLGIHPRIDPEAASGGTLEVVEAPPCEGADGGELNATRTRLRTALPSSTRRFRLDEERTFVPEELSSFEGRERLVVELDLVAFACQRDPSFRARTFHPERAEAFDTDAEIYGQRRSFAQSERFFDLYDVVALSEDELLLATQFSVMFIDRRKSFTDGERERIAIPQLAGTGVDDEAWKFSDLAVDRRGPFSAGWRAAAMIEIEPPGSLVPSAAVLIDFTVSPEGISPVMTSTRIDGFLYNILYDSNGLFLGYGGAGKLLTSSSSMDRIRALDPTRGAEIAAVLGTGDAEIPHLVGASRNQVFVGDAAAREPRFRTEQAGVGTSPIDAVIGLAAEVGPEGLVALGISSNGEIFERRPTGEWSPRPLRAPIGNAGDCTANLFKASAAPGCRFDKLPATPLTFELGLFPGAAPRQLDLFFDHCPTLVQFHLDDDCSQSIFLSAMEGVEADFIPVDFDLYEDRLTLAGQQARVYELTMLP